MDSIEIQPRNSTERKFLKTFESILNTINHNLIGLITVYMSWRIFHGNLTVIPLHAWLCICGFQLLMAEGILILNPENAWSRYIPFKLKRIFHWILQVIGAILGVSGAFLIISRINRKHFVTTHGVLGIIATVTTLLNLMVGLCNYSSPRLERIIGLNTVKTLHTIFGISGFVSALMALFYGYPYYISGEVLTLFEVSTGVTIILTLIGPFKSFFILLNLNDLFSH
ncbi:unnamed protein product [Hermetia illucens]|uniref:ascorbate ferrireductase (transmembrane) n=1 Tax=Hermetia illucens TaxID=343691 RepID=A0A7R8YUB9_HERIL|nr:unnamed protein product [Hermetia illucens]